MGLSLSGSAQEQEPSAPAPEQTIRVEVPLVNLYPTVRTRQGRYVPDLQPQDFEILEDGVAQEIAHFSHGGNIPITLVLALDTSRSQERVFEQEKSAGIQLLEQLLRAEDQALLLTFDLDVIARQGLTSDVGLLVAKVKSSLLSNGMPRRLVSHAIPGGTRLFDALYLGAQEGLAPAEGRKAIVVISDGLEEGSLVSRLEVREHCHRADVMVYALRIADTAYYGQPFSRRSEWVLQAGSKGLKELSDETGGAAFLVSNPKELTGAIEQIAQELRSQYFLSYYPSNRSREGKFRRIEIKLKRPGLKVRARTGYYGPSPEDSQTNSPSQ